MNKYLLEYGIDERFKYNAGSKARVDIFDSLEENNFKTIYLNHGKGKLEKLKHLLNIRRELSGIEGKSIVCIPFPLCNYLILKSIIKNLRKKKCKLICVIHDINSLRFEGSDSKNIKNDINILNKFDVLIVHNKEMEHWLIENGLNVKCISINVFDYLIEENSSEKYMSEAEIIFAGNLSEEKSGFIYKINDNVLKNKKLDLFGVNIGKITCNKISYKGKFNPNRLPTGLNGKYGLVWDGNSVDTCSGMLGEYLKYNNPHKLSLYIAMGIPVIVWNKSAISDFVKNENIGVIINKLEDIDKAIESADYEKLYKNVNRIQKNVISGENIKSAINKAIDFFN